MKNVFHFQDIPIFQIFYLFCHFPESKGQMKWNDLCHDNKFRGLHKFAGVIFGITRKPSNLVR